MVYRMSHHSCSHLDLGYLSMGRHYNNRHAGGSGLYPCIIAENTQHHMAKNVEHRGYVDCLN